MKRWLIFVLTLIMAACEPVTDLAYQEQVARYQAQQAAEEAERLRGAMTATANAPILRVTEGAAALQLEHQKAQMTEQAYLSTVQAAWTPTPNVTATYEMAVVIAQQTAIQAESERNVLKLQRERNTNNFWSVALPLTWTFVAIVAIWVVMQITRRNRLQTVQRDARGDAPLLVDTVDGIVSDPDASPNFQAGTRAQKKLEGNPLPQLPAVTPERQDRVKQADQMLDLGTRGLPGPVNSRSENRRQIAVEEAMKQLPAGTDKFKVLGPGDTPPTSVVDPDTIEILDAQWKEVEE